MRKIIILAEQDFQDMELMYPYYRFIEDGCDVTIAGGGSRAYKGKFGYPIEAEDISNFRAEEYDAVIIPGGFAPDYMRRNPKFTEFVREMNSKNKIIAAICHGGWMLASSGCIKGKKVTSFFAIKDDLVNAGANWVDEEVVVDGNIITSRKPDDLPAFCKAIMKKLKNEP